MLDLNGLLWYDLKAVKAQLTVHLAAQAVHWQDGH